MDGTLLNSKSQVSKDFFDLFRHMRMHDIEFVAASGRQYNSIHEKLQPIYKEITIVAENGGYIKRDDVEIDSVHLDPKTVLDLVPVLRNAQGVYTVLCGKKSAYVESKDETFIEILQEYYNKFISSRTYEDFQKAEGITDTKVPKIVDLEE